MTTLLVILYVIVTTTYVLVRAMAPERTHRSMFELRRLGDEATLRRERLLESVVAILRFKVALLAALLGILGVLAWQYWGLAVTLGVLLLAVPLSRVTFINRYAEKSYRSVEPYLLDAVIKYPVINWLLLGKRHDRRDQKLESPEQLLHLIETSGHVLDDDQRTIIRNGIDWHGTLVRSVMTKRSDIVSIKHTELLGPLVLDDLHRTGHNRFPVTKGGLDTIVGTLDITELLEIDSGKSSQTAEKAMSPQALRIEQDAPLPEALALLQKSRQHVLVVIDGGGKTVGLVTLSDITGSLLGR